MTAAALAAVLVLVGAASAWAAFVTEGSPYAVGDDPLSLNAGDFNGDGRPDVATINGTSSNVSVFLRQAGGGFAQEAGSPIAVGSGPSGAAVGDYNGDGRCGPRGVELRRGQRVGAAAPAGRRLRARGRRADLARRAHHAVAAGDFNSDGRLDLAVTQSDGSQVMVLLRNAPNTGFSAQAQLRDRGDPGRDRRRRLQRRRARRPGDRQPGRRQRDDPAAGSPAATFSRRGGGPGRRRSHRHRRRRLRRQRPRRSRGHQRRPRHRLRLPAPPANDGFTAEPPIAVSASPVGIDAADFDRDGRPDLAVAANGGAVDILRRNAGGGFTRDQPIPLAGAVNDVAAADFDGDSRPDLAASSYTWRRAPIRSACC